MKRTAVLWLLSLTSLAAFAGEHPNLAKGFHADGVYQTHGIDSVNAFNGNLTLTIPIGQPYPIGGGLSYQLRLYGNSTIWDAEERYDLNMIPEVLAKCDPHGTGSCMHAFPDRRANAGLGWSFSLGRLYPPLESTNDKWWHSPNQSGGWMYESPDGSEHRFRPSDPNVTTLEPGGAFYSDDGAHLRLRRHPSGQPYFVDFPNGEVHTFAPNDDPGTADDDSFALIAPWLLTRIGNQFAANALTVTYRRDAEHLIDGWTLSDGFRTHTVTLVKRPFESGVLGVATWDNHRMLVDKVTLATFGQTTAEYRFAYEQASATRPPWHNIPTTHASAYGTVQILRSLTLPDDTKYAFGTGIFSDVTLPTGGRIEWTSSLYSFPSIGGDGNTYLHFARGVTGRVLRDRDAVVIGTWSYQPELNGAIAPSGATGNHVRNSVTDPLGNRTEQYFKADPYSSILDEPPSDYGKPFTTAESVVRGPDDTVYLSERFFPAGAATPAQATYLRYDGAHREVVASRHVHLDDDGAYLDTDRSDPDGLGHYRTTTTRGTGVPTRVSTTAYNPGSTPASLLRPAPTQAWLLETFTARTVSDGSKTFASQYDFDPLNGFLRRVRTVKDTGQGAPGASDIIAVFEPDARGNVEVESYYGGDGGNLSTAGPLRDVPLPDSQRQYRLRHTYSNGSLATSRFVTPSNTPMSFHTVDADIDANTGLASVMRDSAGVGTAYAYDTMSRLRSAKPSGRAWTKYTYPTFVRDAGGVWDDVIVVTQYPPGSENDAGRLGRSRHGIDFLGRPHKEWVEMPGGAESHQYTIYNALGWKTRVSELGRGSAIPQTLFTYDAYGRVLTRKAPDGTETANEYKGIRKTTRKSYISTLAPAQADTPVSTIEETDLYGRLVRVTEQSGPTDAAAPIGAPVVTEYTYDPANRLTGVLMNKGGSVVQQREFDYDGRGFLRWESHPEAGITSYTYDSRGNVTGRTQAAAKSLFDLKYTYDAAGRIEGLQGRNPFHDPNNVQEQPEFRFLKSYVYGEETLPAAAGEPADLRNGKLVTVRRYNYGLDPNDALYRIDHIYAYRDVAGRTSSRTTTITRTESGNSVVLKQVRLAMTWNPLDLVEKLSYPMCTDCGAPPVDPAREKIVRTYDHGRLVSLGRPASGDIPAQTFLSNATFWPNGMQHLLVHGNGITDKQMVGNMARPTELSFGRYDRCVLPAFTAQPVSTTSANAGDPAVLSVTVTGAGPFTYEWWDSTGARAGSTSAITVHPTVTTEYYVVVTGACGRATSHPAKVSIGVCEPPSTGTIKAVRQPDGSWILRPNPSSRANPQYEWREQPSNVLRGTSETLAVAALTATTTYTLTITDSCGSSTSAVTVQVPLPITKNGLTATMITPTRIEVKWPSVAGATSYVLERRSGATWQKLPSTPAPASPYYDDTVVPGRTYAYRVYARGDGTESDYSNAAVATTRSFTAAVAGTDVTPVPANDMLAAVNSVRAAAGWPPVTWSDVLAPNDPIPAPANFVLARHITSSRARMNEALQALGVVIEPYTHPDLKGVAVAAEHINEIQRRAQ